MLTAKTKAQLLNFRRVRDWEQFHSPRNLAIAISVEAAELLEIFQWATEEQALSIAATRRRELSDEIADLTILLTYLANDLSIDVRKAVESKIESNEKKYPINRAKGSNKKYTEL